MYAAILKDRIGGLPNDQFLQAWECIEAIDAALAKAGPTAVLALTYVRTLHEERLAALLTMQEGRITHLISNVAELNQNIAGHASACNKAHDNIAKLRRRLARSKKTKSKR